MIFWSKKFILFHRLRHPAGLGHEEVTAFLIHLASEKHKTASTQNQSLSSIRFLYREILKIQLPWLSAFECSSRSRYSPVVFSSAEARSMLTHLTGTHWLMASLLYGSGLRLLERCILKVKDIDFAYQQITVRDSKGEKERVTVLPSSLNTSLADHLTWVRSLHERDNGRAPLPHALAHKYPTPPESDSTSLSSRRLC
jgi:site-specific recombinase XerD